MIAAIADDLTGAAEIAGIAWRHSLAAEIVLSPEELKASSPAGLIALDSDSRSGHATESAMRAARAASALAETKPAWIYKKVDSVLRGNVLAEIEAIQQTLGFKLAMLVPANPSAGRIIRDGHYFINGRPICRTDFARDPEYPRSSSDVRELLGVERSSAVRLLKPGEVIPQSGIVVGEVSCAADVEYWAAQKSRRMLCAGGGEFFAAMMKVSGHGTVRRPPVEGTSRPRELFVCGSTSDYTRNFVKTSEAEGVPVFPLPRGSVAESRVSLDIFARTARRAAAAFSTHNRVILSIGLPLIEERAAARELALDLARIAGRVLESYATGAISVYVEGGATGVALARQMRWQKLEVVGEIAQGVVTMRPKGSNALLTLKPGSYPGWPAVPGLAVASLGV